MRPPITEKQAMTDAEKACFDMFCKELGLKSGVTAQLGAHNGYPDAFVFSFGEIRNGEQTHDPDINTLHFAATATLYGLDRTKVQQTIMAIIGFLPRVRELLTDTNIVWFLLAEGGVSPITVTDTHFVGNNETYYPVYTAALSFDAGFLFKPVEAS